MVPKIIIFSSYKEHGKLCFPRCGLSVLRQEERVVLWLRHKISIKL